MKKTCRFLTLAALVVTVGVIGQSAFGNSFLSTAASPDNDWATPANWNTGAVPNVANTTGGAFGDRVAIGAPNQFPGSVDNGHAVVRSLVPDIDNVLHVGLNGGDGTLEIIAGGSLTNLSSLVLGEAAGSGDSTGTVLMSGGVLNINGGATFANRAGAGFTATSNWIQTGGTAFVASVIGWAGDSAASVGTVSANFDISGGSLELSNGVGPHADVSILLSGAGQYIVDGDWLSDLTLGGIASAVPGLGGTYDVSTGQTTIFAVPEPTSFVLFGIGGLVIMARRRNA